MNKPHRNKLPAARRAQLLARGIQRGGFNRTSVSTSSGIIQELITHSASLIQQHTLHGVLTAAGEVALQLFGVNRGLIIFFEAEIPIHCAWSKGLSEPFIRKMKKFMGDDLGPAKTLIHPAAFIRDVKKTKLIGSDWQSAFSEEGVRSLGVWPLIAEGTTVAILGCMYNVMHTWREEERDKMRFYLRLVAAAIENAQLFESMQGRTQETLALYRALTPLFNAHLGTKDLGRQITETVKQEFSSAYCSIFLYDEALNALRWVAEAGYNQDPIEAMPLDGPGLTVSAYQLGKFIYAPDVANDARYVTGSPLTRCELTLPLRTASGVLGVINMESQELDAFDEATRQVLISYAERAALAIENSQLFEIMRQRANQMKSLNEMTQSALEAADQEKLLQSLADKVGELFDSDGACIVFHNEEGQLTLSSGNRGPGRFRNNTLPLPKKGNGLTMEVLSSGQPRVVEDAAQSEFIDKNELKHDPVTSLLGLPLNANQQTHGMVMIGFFKPHHFSQEEIALGEQAAGQIALSLLKMQSLNLAHRRAQEAETLRSATAALTTSLTLQKVLPNILSLLEQVVPHDSACIFLRHGDMLSADAGKGISEADGILGNAFPVDNPFYQEISATGQPLVLFDAQLDQRMHILGKTSRTRGWMGIPLIAGGDIIGVLTLESFKTGTFKNDRAGLAQAFANQAAAALQNARLYEEAQQRAHQLTALHHATAALESTLEIDVLVKRILEAAASAVTAAEKGRLVMFNADNGALQVQASIGYPDKERPDGSFPEHATFIINAIREGHAAVSTSIDIPHGSVIIAPLLVNPQVFGAISLESSVLNAFNNSDLDLLVSFASTANAAIRSAQLYAEVQKLAITDPLTELYNRRGFFELGSREYERAYRYGHPLACIMIDTDLLKKINDSCGHAQGDQVLVSIAKQCRYSLRKTDIIGRYGGDEFAILLPETDITAAKEIATRLQEAISRKMVPCNDTFISVTVSMGVAVADHKVQSVDALLSRADVALYNAKQAGRNRLVFWEGEGG